MMQSHLDIQGQKYAEIHKLYQIECESLKRDNNNLKNELTNF